MYKKPAHRSTYFARKIKKDKKNKFHFLKFLIPIVFFILLFVFVKVNTQVWNGRDKVAFVYTQDGGDVGIIVLDPVLEEFISLNIPGDTQVKVARNYGRLRLKNVWQLGVNEDLKGILLAETVTRNFLFPVFLWKNKPPGIESGNLKNVFEFIFFPGETNISFGDRVGIGFFSINIPELGKTSIDLGRSQFLDKGKLEDGLPGYRISGSISQRLTVYFSDNSVSGRDLKVGIMDATGIYGVSENLGEILQVIGGKVVSVDKKTTSEEFDCLVNGNYPAFTEKVLNLFSCDKGDFETVFDLEIKIGKTFADRF